MSKMAMGRNLRLYHNLPNVGPQQPYSLILDNKGQGEEEYLLIENYAIASIGFREYEEIKMNYVKHTDAYGCLGILRINEDDNSLYFLVMVTGCSSVGKLGTSEIYRLNNVAMISVRGNPQDEEKVSEIKKLLMCGTFYFSWSSSEQTFDLTLAAQKLARNESTDNRFFWNRMLHIPFVRHGVDNDKWLLKVVCGSVEIRTVYVGSKQAKACVISRLSSERAGTRFQVRGVDDNGYVANFAETEQSVFLGDDVSSYVQIRGSVPLFWDQPGINVGSHKIRLSRGPDLSSAAFDAHFKQLKQIYGNQVIVNLLGSSLVGNKEGEATLSTAYQAHHKSCSHHSDIPHILFDYHMEVKSGSNKNLSKLKKKVQDYVAKFEFFTKKESAVSREQYGTIRTNCTDCLDRTNCIQTFLGAEVLDLQLQDLGLNGKPNIVSRFHEMFKAMWQSNGNELSKMYAGTGALGASHKLIDGARSAARTIQNNLLYATKQEAIDVLLFGSSLKSHLADRARVLLPSHCSNAPRPILEKLEQHYTDYCDAVPLRIAIGNYNINGGKHFRSIVYKDVSLSDWLLDAHKLTKGSALINLSESPTDKEKPIDIYAVGFEEMVDLDAKNIMNACSENAKGWATELTKTLNRDERFTLIAYQQLVGVCLYVFARPEHAQYIRDVAVDCVKTGMGGATGNKGTVAIRFRYHSTSLCFVCSHFAAGQNNISDRNNDFNEAVKRIMFPRTVRNRFDHGSKSKRLQNYKMEICKGRNLLNHDYIFWCGDFNYRINMGREDIKALVNDKDWKTLYLADQLRVEKEAGNVFQDFHEGIIEFPPTYKYDLFSDDYDTSEKCRAPAWTDRVLWRRKALQGESLPCPGLVHWYGRSELKQSDHRPVLAVLDAEVLKVDEAKRGQIFEDSLSFVGPPDGSVMLKLENPELDIKSVIDDRFMEALHEKVEGYGKIRFVKCINKMIWVAFMNHANALDVVNIGLVEICGHNFNISLKQPNWKILLKKELDLCSNYPVALSAGKQNQASTRFSSIQEFDNLNLTSANLSVVPKKPLPSRPAPPRPCPPPPGPDPTLTYSASSPPKSTLPFFNPTKQPPTSATPNECDPLASTTYSERPLSSKTQDSADASVSSCSNFDSVNYAANNNAAVNKNSHSSPSLAYPEDYDPLKEAFKSWGTGIEQTVPVISSDGPPELLNEATPPVAVTPRDVLAHQSSTEDQITSSKSSTSLSTDTKSRVQLLPSKRGAPPPPPPPVSSRPSGPPPTLPSRPPPGPPPPIPKR